MVILDGFELLQRLLPDSSATLEAQVIMELAPIDMMTAVEYWLQKQVCGLGLRLMWLGLSIATTLSISRFDSIRWRSR